MRGSNVKMTHFLSKSEKLSSLQINRHLSITPSVDSTCQIGLNTEDAETFKTETYLAVKTFQQDLKFHNESLKITNKQGKSWHLWFSMKIFSVSYIYHTRITVVSLPYFNEWGGDLKRKIGKKKLHKNCIAIEAKNHKLILFQWLDPWWLLQKWLCNTLGYEHFVRF